MNPESTSSDPEAPGGMISLSVDDCRIEAPAGANLLSVCLDNGIYIPHLCYLKAAQRPAGACRMCFVEIEGRPAPVAACTIKVEPGLSVRSDTPAVRRLQKSALRMLLSVHRVDCKNCHANKCCDLQRIAKFLKVGLNSKPLPLELKAREVDDSHPRILHYPNRCVLCGKCVAVCRDRLGHAGLTFARRGFATVVTFFGPTTHSACEQCQACVDVCPVGAMALKPGFQRPPAQGAV
jgi:bidirectional [NiFe] hydrogenase diaphorase subunit